MNSQPSSSQVSPSLSDDNNVWKRKPGPEKNPEDSPDPIQEKRKKGNGRKFRKHKSGSGVTNDSQSSDGRRYSRDKAFSNQSWKHEQSKKGKCRLMSWPQAGLGNEPEHRLNLPDADKEKSKSHESADKIQEVCVMLENHLKELLLLNDGKQTLASINEQFYLDYEQIRQIWEPAFGDLIRQDDADRPMSPEYKENHLWYTEPMGEIFESDEQPGRRLYKRHSFPPGNMFILATVNSRSFMPFLLDKIENNACNSETRDDEALLLPLCIDECPCKEGSDHETPLSPFFLDGNQNIDVVSDAKYDWLCSREPDEFKIAVDNDLDVILNQDDDLPAVLYQESPPSTMPNFTIGSVNDTPLTGLSEDTEEVDHLQDNSMAVFWSPVTEQEKSEVSLLDWSYLSQFLDDTELLSHYFPHLDSVYRHSHESPGYLVLDYSPFAYGGYDCQDGLYDSWTMQDRNPCVRTPIIVSDLEVIWPGDASVDSESNPEKSCWQNQLLMEEFSYLEHSLNEGMFRSYVGGSQLSQLWDVNMHRRQSASTGCLLGSRNSFICPERPESFSKLQMHFESVVSGMPVFMFDNLCTLWADTDENTLIPQITLDVAENDDAADDVFLDDLETLSDTSESFDGPSYILDRSISLGDMKQPQWDILGLSLPLSSRKPELSRSFELVPSTTSAFQDVVPRNLHHVQSEPNMKVGDLLAEFTNSGMEAELSNQSEGNEEDLLYFSSKTHFRPIQTPVGTPESSECLRKDIFGDPTLYQPYSVPELEEEVTFVPRFRIQKDMDKYIQTGSSIDEGDGCNLSPIPEVKDKRPPQYSPCDFDIECSNAMEELPDIILSVTEPMTYVSGKDIIQITADSLVIGHNIAGEAEQRDKGILSSFSQWEMHQLWDSDSTSAEQPSWPLQDNAKSIWNTDDNVGISGLTNAYSLHTGSFADESAGGETIPSAQVHEEHSLIDDLMFCDTKECADTVINESPDDTPIDNLDYDELFFMDLGEDELIFESANANTQVRALVHWTL